MFYYQLAETLPFWQGVILSVIGLLLIVYAFWENKHTFLNYQSRQQAYRVKVVFNLLMGFIIGMSWAFWHAFFLPKLPSIIFAQPVWGDGQVTSLVESSKIGTRNRYQFAFDVDNLRYEDGGKVLYWQEKGLSSAKLRLSWYHSAYSEQRVPSLGERWRLRLVLKPNHSSSNFAAFDYEQWLFQKGFIARGYIKPYDKREKQQLLEKGQALTPVMQPQEDVNAYQWQSWRYKLFNRLQTVYQDSPFASFYQADVASDDWLVL